MYFPRFLVFSACALMLLLALAFIATWSVFYSVILATLAALALQVGYFVAVVYLVIRGDPAKREQSSVTDERALTFRPRRNRSSVKCARM